MQNAGSGYRTLFISDVHLGSPGCRAGKLLEFLRATPAQAIFLVGDIVDCESLARRFFWPRAHAEVVRTLLTASRRGTRVVYVPGNHDMPARAWCGLKLGRIEFRREVVHRTADGRRLLVMHGDEFDRHLGRGGWLNRLGSLAYRQLVALNAGVDDWRERAGLSYWPVASSIKHRSGRARAYIDAFRGLALAHAGARGLDGCVTGHIHRPEIHAAGGLDYLNCGDWVEHCTALAERHDGRIELVDWAGAHRAIVRRTAGLPLRRAA